MKLTREASMSPHDPIDDLIELLEQAQELLLDAQRLTDTETKRRLREYQKMVSAAESRVTSVLTEIRDDANGTW